MAKKFKDSLDAIAKLHKHIGVQFPVSVLVEEGRIVTYDFETEWGTSEAEGAPVKMHKLTSAQITEIKDWVKDSQTTTKSK